MVGQIYTVVVLRGAASVFYDIRNFPLEDVGYLRPHILTSSPPPPPNEKKRAMRRRIYCDGHMVKERKPATATTWATLSV